MSRRAERRSVAAGAKRRPARAPRPAVAEVTGEELLASVRERSAHAATNAERAALGRREFLRQLGKPDEARVHLVAARLHRLARFVVEGDAATTEKLDEIESTVRRWLHGRDVEETFKVNVTTRTALFPALEAIVLEENVDAIARAARLLGWVRDHREQVPAIREHLTIEWLVTEDEARAGTHKLASALAEAIERCDRDRAIDGTIAISKVSTRVLRALGLPPNAVREIANR